VLMAVTWIVTVTEPPDGIVTEPANTPLALKVKVLVTAPPLTWLPMRASVLLNWLGRLSLMVPVKVDGPAFVTTSVKLVVLPSATVLEPTSLLGLMLTVAVTLKTALTVNELVPTEVVKEPAGMVFVTVPPVELVTTTVTVQVDDCGIKVPSDRVKEPVLGVAVAEPEIQPVVLTDDGEAFTKPAG
jgi:hypothetical protein